MIPLPGGQVIILPGDMSQVPMLASAIYVAVCVSIGVIIVVAVAIYALGTWFNRDRSL